jgi:hypothetical protein
MLAAAVVALTPAFRVLVVQVVAALEMAQAHREALELLTQVGEVAAL